MFRNNDAAPPKARRRLRNLWASVEILCRKRLERTRISRTKAREETLQGKSTSQASSSKAKNRLSELSETCLYEIQLGSPAAPPRKSAGPCFDSAEYNAARPSPKQIRGVQPPAGSPLRACTKVSKEKATDVLIYVHGKTRKTTFTITRFQGPGGRNERRAVVGKTR